MEFSPKCPFYQHYINTSCAILDPSLSNLTSRIAQLIVCPFLDGTLQKILTKSYATFLVISFLQPLPPKKNEKERKVLLLPAPTPKRSPGETNDSLALRNYVRSIISLLLLLFLLGLMMFQGLQALQDKDEYNILPGLKMLYSLVKRYLYTKLCDKWYIGVLNVVLRQHKEGSHEVVSRESQGRLQ